VLKENDKIVFFGDSITELGRQPNGYVTLIQDTLARRHPGVRIIGAGISGNKVTDLLQRLERDVLTSKPTIVFVYIGINDVWHSILPGHSGTTKDRYESGLTELVSSIRTAGARVILCTASVIGERWDGKNPLDVQLEEYAAISRRVAREAGIELCDLRKAFIDYLTTHNPGKRESGILTQDGVHLNDEGNRLVAHEMLKMLQ
jgi:lysophospholipase L1-like esterase